MPSALSHASRPAPWRAELLACLSLGWPLVVTNAIEMAMSLTNTAMVARVSPNALAAVPLALALYHVALLFGIGVTAAVSPLIAHQLGRGGTDGPAVRRVVQQGIWAALLITGPIWLVLWQAEPILLALGQQPALVTAAAGYLRALEWAILPAFVYLVLRSTLAAFERPRAAVVVGFTAVMLNALLNRVLIFGLGPVPPMGLFGSGLATLASNTLMAAAMAAVALRHPRVRAFRLFSGLAWPRWSGFGAFWALGLPIGIGLVLETGMFAVAAGLVGLFDAPSLAAHAIALQAASLTFMVPLGLAQAATVRVGRAAGAGDRAAVARSGRTALALGMGSMLVLGAVLLAVPHAIIGLFIGDAEPGAAAVQEVGATLLRLAGLFSIADGAQVVLSGMLRGLKDTRAPMMIAAAGYWGVGLPLGALLAFPLGLRAPGVWLGLTAGIFAVAGLLFVRWRQRLRGPLPRSAVLAEGVA